MLSWVSILTPKSNKEVDCVVAENEKRRVGGSRAGGTEVGWGRGHGGGFTKQDQQRLEGAREPTAGKSGTISLHSRLAGSGRWADLMGGRELPSAGNFVGVLAERLATCLRVPQGCRFASRCKLSDSQWQHDS